MQTITTIGLLIVANHFLETELAAGCGLAGLCAREIVRDAAA